MSQCVVIEVGKPDKRGWTAKQCTVCGTLYPLSPPLATNSFTAKCKLVKEALPEEVPVSSGPGTELTRLLDSLGAKPNSSCNCKAKAAEMDSLGVEGCKRDRERLVGWLKEGYAILTLTDVAAFTKRAITSGLVFKLNPLDVAGSLLDEAIRRADGPPT